MERDATVHGRRSIGGSNGRHSGYVEAPGDTRAAPEHSDRELALRLRTGDAEALTALYDRYAASVIGMTRGILRDSRLAEEAAQDVFLGLWQNPHGYDASRGAFSGWLFRVARNRAIDLLRRRREQPFATTLLNESGETIDPATFLVDDEPDPADQAVVALQREAVRRGLRELSVDHRRLLEMAYFSGMTQSEIAARMERPLGTVKTQIRSAMRRLADVLDDAAPDATSRGDETAHASTDDLTSRVSHTGGFRHLADPTRPVRDERTGDSKRR